MLHTSVHERPRVISRLRLRGLLKALIIEGCIVAFIVGVPSFLYFQPNNFTGYKLALFGGHSMQPLLGTEVNIVLLHNGTSNLRRFDVVQSAVGNMHRVVGLPGDTVWVAGCHAHGVDRAGHAWVEPTSYVRLCNPNFNVGPIHLGNDDYLWLADNRSGTWYKTLHRTQLVAILTAVLFAHGGRFH